MRAQLTAFVACSLGLAACHAADEPTTSTTGQELVTVLPATFDFGSVQVGDTSGAHPITINPAAGNQFDTVSSITMACSDFVNGATGLPAIVYRDCEVVTCFGSDGMTPVACPVACQTVDIESYTFNTYFRPTVAGTVSCVVNINLNTGGAGAVTRTVTLTGTGTPPPIHINVAPGSLNFGDVRANTDSSAATITVANSGGQALSVSSVTAGGAFAIATGPTGPYQVPAGGQQAYQVTCHPTATGAASGNFVVTSNDPAHPQVTVPLSCNGVDSALSIQPSPAALATTRVGEPVQATIAIVNSGGAPATIQSVAVTGAGITMIDGPPANTSLAANGGSANVTVSFDAATSGDASGTLNVTYDSGQQRTSQITARALSTSMALTPDGDVDFGPVCAGQMKSQTFSVIANDQGPFKVTDISAPSAPFQLNAPTLPAGVQGAGASTVSFDVIAAPDAAGLATSTVTLATDIPGGTPRTLNLTVTGLTAGVTPTPDMLDLGSNPVNTTTIGQQIQLSNCLESPVTWTNARIEGADAADFAIVAQPTAMTIAPTGLAAWLVVLQAHSVGNKEATFAVDYDGGTAMVALAGEGLGETDPTKSSNSSYYACSAGGAAGMGPLALVALALCVRRRRRA